MAKSVNIQKDRALHGSLKKAISPFSIHHKLPALSVDWVIKVFSLKSFLSKSPEQFGLQSYLLPSFIYERPVFLLGGFQVKRKLF